MSRISFSMMEAGYIPGDLGAFKKEAGKIKLYGDSPPSQPTDVTQRSLTFPEQLQPYAETLLGKAQALTDKPYEKYEYDRLAKFDPMQLAAQQAAANLGPSKQLGAATQMAGLAGLNAGNIKYDPTTFNNQFTAPPAYSPATMSSYDASSAQLGIAPTATAANMQAASFLGPQDIGFERVAAEKQLGGTMSAAKTAYDPNLINYQMGPAKDITTGSFAAPNAASAYMSPYMQSVVDIQKREAQRAADIASTQRGAQAVAAGAFGGSRQAIMEAEAARNLAQQKGDIQAQGSQAAFQQAQQQFNAEQAAKLQAQQANQQAGLTVGQQNLAANLGVQQLGKGQIGLQTALANLSSEQQANVQNLAAKLQTQGLNAQQAMQAALANQQSGLTAGQFNATMDYNTSLQNAQLQQQAAMANQQAQQQTALANQAMTGQYGIQQGQFGQQTALANQQAKLAAQQAAEQSKQYGYGQGMTAAQQAAQYGLAGQQAGEQSKQFGANLGLQGLQTQLSAAGTLGQLGQTQFGQEKDIINAQAAAGGQRQAAEQALMDQKYGDFQRQQQYPYQQLSYMSDLLRGAPMGNLSQSIYQAPPSTAATLAGLGTTALGASRYFAKGGLTTLALHNMTK